MIIPGLLNASKHVFRIDKIGTIVLKKRLLSTWAASSMMITSAPVPFKKIKQQYKKNKYAYLLSSNHKNQNVSYKKTTPYIM